MERYPACRRHSLLVQYAFNKQTLIDPGFPRHLRVNTNIRRTRTRTCTPRADDEVAVEVMIEWMRVLVVTPV